MQGKIRQQPIAFCKGLCYDIYGKQVEPRAMLRVSADRRTGQSSVRAGWIPAASRGTMQGGRSMKKKTFIGSASVPGHGHRPGTVCAGGWWFFWRRTYPAKGASISHNDLSNGTTVKTIEVEIGTAFTKEQYNEAVKDLGTKEGYTFAGWFQNSDGSNPFYVGDTWPDGSGAKGLYAKWTANNSKYTVKFNANATDATGTMADAEWDANKMTRVSLAAALKEKAMTSLAGS